MDISGGEAPKSMNDNLVSATSTCVVVGTISAADGEAQITLTDEGNAHATNFEIAFDGEVATPSGKIAVFSARKESLLEAAVPGKRSNIQVWVNHDSEPDVIIIIINRESEARVQKARRSV